MVIRLHTVQAFRERCERAFRSRKKCAVVAFVFTFVLFGLCYVSWIPTGVNDDWALSNGLSGNWEGDWGLCLFLNAALTRAIYFLNVSVGQVNWYFLAESLTAFCSYFCLAYVSLSRMRLPLACLLAMSMTVLLVPGSTCESNFTYVAGFAACAGGTALVCSLSQERHSIPLVTAGVLLLTMGSLWRWTMFLLCVPVFGVAALILAFRKSERTVIMRLCALWPFALALVLFAVFHAFDAASWQGEWAEWQTFNDERSMLSDYPHASYAEAQEALSALGVSANDYTMVRSWMTEDPDFFTLDRLEAINEATLRVDGSASWVIQNIANYLLNLATAPKLGFVILMALVGVCACLAGKERHWGLVLLACALVLAVVLAVLGRLPSRVHYPLWTYAIAALGATCTELAEEPVRGRSHVVFEVGAGIMTILPIVAVTFVLAVALPHVRLERVVAELDPDSFQPSNYLLDYIEEHEDSVFVMSTASSSTLVFANLMIKPYDSQLLEQVVSIGGWAARAPYAIERNERIGMRNPIRDLVENKHALYIAPGSDTADMLKTYLQEHYYPNVIYEQVDVIESDSSSKAYVYCFNVG